MDALGETVQLAEDVLDVAQRTTTKAAEALLDGAQSAAQQLPTNGSSRRGPLVIVALLVAVVVIGVAWRRWSGDDAGAGGNRG